MEIKPDVDLVYDSIVKPTIEDENKWNHQDLGDELGKLVDKKNEEYGDSFNQAGKVLEILYPDGIKPEQYTDVLSVVRLVDKLFRIASSTPAERQCWDESPYKDIGGYGLLGWRREKYLNPE